MDLMNIVYFIGASMLLTIAPGPDIIFVLTQSIAKGSKEGILIALGLCTGLLVHTAAAALGISVILYHSSFAFQLLKIAGALYLFYLAWQAIREVKTSKTAENPPTVQLSNLALYRRGILMNVLNPKVSLFFLAFLPQFISPSSFPIPLQMLLLGFIFLIQALLVFSLVSLVAHHLSKYMLNKAHSQVWVSRGIASIYAVLGARLLFLDRS